MSRKNMPLIIGGAVVLLLVLGLGYFLFSVKSRYSDDVAKLSSERNKLQRLTSRTPFPSDENVQIMGRQLDIYEDYLDGLFASMSQGQTAIGAVDGDRFRRMLETVLRKLLNDARAHSVSIPTEFPFGFHRYVQGAPPVASELPRLLNQLQAVAVLCGILYESGISELLGVERTMFEQDAQMGEGGNASSAGGFGAEEPAGRRPRRRGAEPEPTQKQVSTELVRDEDGLFTKEHYVLVYRARDEANWKVLDRLAQGAPFAVVTQMEVVNSSRPAVVPPPTESVAPTGAAAQAGRSTGAPVPEILPRDLRVVAGRELPTVRLEVDLYRFTEAAPDTPAEESR
jgi:hypothetical protein